jgi:hypothetical protein
MSEPTYVPQRQSWDCGIACLAMVAGIPYEAAWEVVGPSSHAHGQLNGGLPTTWMPSFLGKLGIAVRCGFAKQGPEWWHDGLTGLRLADVSGHYIVVLPDNRVHDPARGPTPRHVSDYPQAFNVWEIHRVCVGRGTTGGTDDQ